MPELIPASLLASLSALDESAMPARCSLVRDIAVPDGRGGQRTTPSTLATDVPCRLTRSGTEQSARIVALAEQLAVEAAWLIEIPLVVRDADGNPVTVKPGDKLEIAGKAYPVIKAFAGQSYATSLPIGCKELS
ncbi:MAG TPA: hypothetical protein VFS21_30205 [Roseiflexaceae bacterium]|nr:hypothetical protein [Roseiflexaceae bacterium]